MGVHLCILVIHYCWEFSGFHVLASSYLEDIFWL